MQTVSLWHPSAVSSYVPDRSVSTGGSTGSSSLQPVARPASASTTNGRTRIARRGCRFIVNSHGKGFERCSIIGLAVAQPRGASRITLIHKCRARDLGSATATPKCGSLECWRLPPRTERGALAVYSCFTSSRILPMESDASPNNIIVFRR